MVWGDFSFQNIWFPSESVGPPGPYISNHVLKYAVLPDHSLRNISSGGLFISKYRTDMVPPLKRVPQRLYFSNCNSEIYSPPYCIVLLQGDFSVMYCLPGVSSVVLILVKLPIIAFFAHTLFLSLERSAGYTPVTTYSMANSIIIVLPSVSPLGIPPVVNVTQQNSTKQSIQRRHNSRALLAT